MSAVVRTLLVWLLTLAIPCALPVVAVINPSATMFVTILPAILMFATFVTFVTFATDGPDRPPRAVIA